MANFDINKWNKQRYLQEANLLESKAQEAATAIDKILDEVDPSGILPEDLGAAIAMVVKKGYQASKQNQFMDALHKGLGFPNNLNEGELEDAAKKLNLTLNKKDNKIEVGGDAIDKDEFEGIAKKLGYKVDREVEKGEYDRLYISK